MRVETPWKCPVCKDRPMIVDGRVLACCEHLYYSEEVGSGLILAYSISP